MAQPGGENLRIPGALRPGPRIEGHSIQRDEEQNAYIIDQKLIACTPTEYRVLTLLLEQADHCVLFAQLWEQFQDEPLNDAAQLKQARTRIIHLMSDLRAKIWALGLDIVAVMNYGYILLSRPQGYKSLPDQRGTDPAASAEETE
ncbi:MAG TPA: helix-turn-helix domain-containing protein [Ktedonobacteraceae bacterium]|nr:helix-turn-helix domain-containing protein [Ktedonobacteraceae bacterium]